MNSVARINFFGKQVHDPRWKNSMAGKNEDEAIRVIESIGYVMDRDFVRQFPIGERFVMDFAFVHEQISVEVDGADHNARARKLKDKKRDKYLHDNNWISIRITDADLKDTYRKSFFKNVIKEIVEERRQQWTTGHLLNIDVPYYDDKEYD